MASRCKNRATDTDKNKQTNKQTKRKIASLAAGPCFHETELHELKRRSGSAPDMRWPQELDGLISKLAKGAKIKKKMARLQIFAWGCGLTL